ncbi:MAG: ATP-binding protein [Pseudomonas marincola]
MNIATNYSSAILLLGKENGMLASIKLKNTADPNILLLPPEELEKGDLDFEGEFAAIVAVASDLNDNQQEIALHLQELKPFAHSKLILLHELKSQSVIPPSEFQQGVTFICSPNTGDQIDALIQNSKEHHRETLLRQKNQEELHHALQLLRHGVFQIKTLSEAKSLSTLLASLCPNSTEVALGLIELMINGIEHGNLQITFEEKGILLKEGQWHLEIERRLRSIEHRDKQVTIEFLYKKDRIEFLITDEGLGFDADKYLSKASEEKRKADLTNFHGRGIKLASQLCFQRVEYTGIGNQVKATIELE